MKMKQEKNKKPFVLSIVLGGICVILFCSTIILLILFLQTKSRRIDAGQNASGIAASTVMQESLGETDATEEIPLFCPDDPSSEENAAANSTEKFSEEANLTDEPATIDRNSFPSKDGSQTTDGTIEDEAAPPSTSSDPTEQSSTTEEVSSPSEDTNTPTNSSQDGSFTFED